MKKRAFLFSAITILVATVSAANDDVAEFTPQAPDALIAGNVRAVAYSGFRHGQYPNRGNGAVNPTREQILEDLQLLTTQAGFRLIRLYDSQENSRVVLEVIRDYHLPLRVLLGAWLKAEVSNHEGCAWLTEPIPEATLAENRRENAREVDRAIELARRFPEIVVAVNVGNEALIDWNDHLVPIESMLGYLRHVRASIDQPITTADNYVAWVRHGAALAEVVDFAGVHTYPIWENKTIEESLDYTVENVTAVQQAIPKVPIAIVEAGWASEATEFPAQASEANQVRYFDAIMDWAAANNVTTFWFEAFDEDWKGDPANPGGAEKHWGLYTVGRHAKAVVQHIATNMPTVEIYQTTRSGDRLARISPTLLSGAQADRTLKLDTSRTFQTLIGIGGSFTESGAYVLSELSEAKRQQVLAAYFSPDGAHYSLTRTHIASCDFSLRNYSYAAVPGDVALEHFSIEPDETYLLPMIKQAQAVQGADFKILASPWTAPPWMKTNGTWNGGELLPEHEETFARYLVKYIQAYRALDIPIWGITPENEPLGNDSNWESMHFTPERMRDFIANHLGPTLRAAGLDTTVWIYDQNRDEELLHWADVILGDEAAASYVSGVAVHWYQSTIDVGGEVLDEVQARHPGTRILHSEGCIDALGDDEPIGSWLEDDWYWRPEATDWGVFWAPEDKKKDHPPYRPFYRYVRDLIGGLNHNLVGWIDWNMVLNTRGGPNHARNMCLAPVLVDSGRDHVYYTPLFYAVAHFSKYIRPGARRIGLSGCDDTLMGTAFENPDGTIALVVFNPEERERTFAVRLGESAFTVAIAAQALQTIVLPPQDQ